jgi:uncharacterized protein (TIGR03067 family)
MKKVGLAAFAGCLLLTFTAHGGDEAALKKEKAALQGVWKVVGFETPDGKKDDINGATLDFEKDGKSIVFMHKDETKKGAFKLNPAGKPKEIDITPEGEKTMIGIYLIEKNTLKLCLAPESDARPVEFAPKAGTKQVYITFERAK